MESTSADRLRKTLIVLALCGMCDFASAKGDAVEMQFDLVRKLSAQIERDWLSILSNNPTTASDRYLLVKTRIEGRNVEIEAVPSRNGELRALAENIVRNAVSTKEIDANQPIAVDFRFTPTKVLFALDAKAEPVCFYDKDGKAELKSWPQALNAYLAPGTWSKKFRYQPDWNQKEVLVDLYIAKDGSIENIHVSKDSAARETAIQNAALEIVSHLKDVPRLPLPVPGPKSIYGQIRVLFFKHHFTTDWQIFEPQQPN